MNIVMKISILLPDMTKRRSRSNDLASIAIFLSYSHCVGQTLQMVHKGMPIRFGRCPDISHDYFFWITCGSLCRASAYSSRFNTRFRSRYLSRSENSAPITGNSSQWCLMRDSYISLLRNLSSSIYLCG